VPTPIEQAVATYRSDWTKVQIGATDCARINPEVLAEATDPDFRFRYIDISSVNTGTIDWKAVQSVRFADAPSRARRALQPGDVMLCTVRPMLGSHAHAGLNTGEPSVCSTGFAVIRSGPGLNPRFLRHLPFAEQISRQLVAWQCGTNYPAVNERDVYRLTIPVPTPDEQTAIARVLNAVDQAIERARAAIEQAQELDHALLNKLVESGLSDRQHSKPPAHWQRKRVDEVADVGSGVTLGKDVTGFKHVELPYLRVANVQDGHLNLRTIKTVKVRVDDVESVRLEPGDVLMTEGGDLDKLGRGTLWEGQIPDCLHQNHIFRIRANTALLEPRYFSYVVESDIAKRYFTRVAKRTTNLASTNKTQVRAFTFPLPPLDEQKQIAAIVKAAKARIAALEQKLSTLQSLKKSLLHDLLTGTVRLDPALFAETPA